MKITITMESHGPHGVKLKCDPPITKLKRMARDGMGGPIIAMAGLALKKIFEVIPAQTIKMEGDDKQMFAATNAQATQAARSEATDKILLPGRDF